MSKIFEQIFGGLGDITNMSDKVTEAFGRSAQGISDGVLVANTAVTTAGTEVKHGLGRAAQGAIVVFTGSSANTFLIEPSAINTGNFVKITPGSTNVTISVWVF